MAGINNRNQRLLLVIEGIRKAPTVQRIIEIITPFLRGSFNPININTNHMPSIRSIILPIG